MITGVTRTAEARGEGFTALFDADGHYLKRIAFEQERLTATGAKGKPPARDWTSVSLSRMESAGGMMYLLRPSAERPVVFVLSPAGEVDRTLVLEPPAGEGTARYRRCRWRMDRLSWSLPAAKDSHSNI